MGIPRPRWIFAGALILLTALLLGHNTSLFTRAIYEDTDFAACSIQIARAKHLDLLVGNYSRIGFNHPGPAILYVEAGAEYLFRDWLGLVPAPANAHILGAVLFDAVLLALSLALLHAHFRSLLATVAALAVFLVYFGVNGQLASHWMPYLYFAPFLLLLVTAASVASGEARQLPWLALAGGLLVHGHVCFVVFVSLLSAYAFFGLARRHGFALRDLWRDNKGSCAAFVAVVGLFVLPIALHTLLHFPGEIGKYIDYSRTHPTSNPPGEVAEFVVLVFTSEAAHPWLVALAALAGVALTLPRRADGPRWDYTWQALAASGVATAAMVCYVFRGVDALVYTYTGIFFGAVLLLLATLAAMNAVLLFGVDARRRGVLASLAVAAALGAGASGRFRNPYEGCPFLPEVAARLDATGEDDRPIVVTHTHDHWWTVVGFAVNMDRRGPAARRVFVAEPQMEFLYTAQYVRGWETLTSARHLDFARPNETSRRIRRILYEDEKLSIRELDPLYRPGTKLVFDNRDWEVFRGRGWSVFPTDGACLAGAEGCLTIPLEKPIPCDAVLSVSLDSSLPAPSSEVRVVVVVNGEPVASWSVPANEKGIERRATIPAAVLNRQTPVTIGFQVSRETDPGWDAGTMSLWLRELCLSGKEP